MFVSVYHFEKDIPTTILILRFDKYDIGKCDDCTYIMSSLLQENKPRVIRNVKAKRNAEENLDLLVIELSILILSPQI